MKPTQPGARSIQEMIPVEEIEKWSPAQQREVANALRETAIFVSQVNQEDLRKLQEIPWEKLQQPADPNRPLTEEDKEAYRRLWELVEQGHVTMAQVLGYSEDELYRIYNTGMAFASQGRYDEALKLADGLLFLVPNFLAGLLLKGEALRKSGQIEAALDAYNKAVSADPTFIQSYFERAKLFFTANNMQLFLMDVESIASLDPEARTPFGKRARRILELTEQELLNQGLTEDQIEQAEKQLADGMVDMPAESVPQIDEDGQQISKK